MAWLSFGTLTRELRDGEIVVGSGADADWRVPTADLMPRHFVLTVHGLNATAKPSSTDVVVAVNGKQIMGSSGLLTEGDVIAAGRGQFIYSDETPRITDGQPPAAADTGFLIDEHAKVAHTLFNRSTPLGRDASNAIVVRDPTASRFHAEVRREAGGFALHSMGPSGTTVNGAPLTGPSLLADGDTIEIAHAKLKFVRELPAEGFSMASGHSARNDEAGRRPTVVSNRVRLSLGDPVVGDSGGVKFWVGAAVVVIMAFIAWLVLR